MLITLHIKNLRGIRELEAGPFGRVNLIIGRNDSGKTTLLAAAAMQRSPVQWVFGARYLDDPRPTPFDLERHLVPLFRGGDPTTPAEVWGTTSESTSGWRMSLSRPNGRWRWPARFVRLPDTGESGEQLLDLEQLQMLSDHPGMWWSPAFVEAEDELFGNLLDLYKANRLQALVEPLSQVNPDLERIEVAGNQVFVRLQGHPLPLRYGVLGDGIRRMLEFSVGLTQEPELVLIDELENGFHHTTLPVVLRMLQRADPDKQIFATTHREELIRVACEVFVEAGDDGLRIVRLERGEGEHRAVVYTAAEALAGMDAGLEIRG